MWHILVTCMDVVIKNHDGYLNEGTWATFIDFFFFIYSFSFVMVDINYFSNQCVDTYVPLAQNLFFSLRMISLLQLCSCYKILVDPYKYITHFLRKRILIIETLIMYFSFLFLFIKQILLCYNSRWRSKRCVWSAIQKNKVL